VLLILLGIKQRVNKNREKNGEGDFNRIREVKISGDTVNWNVTFVRDVPSQADILKDPVKERPG